MIPYIPETRPMTGEDQEALTAIFREYGWYSPGHHLNLANRIIKAGFARRVPKKVTRVQLWSYAIETILLAVCALMVADTGQGFVYGALVALMLGSGATYFGGILINQAIKKGARP